jgi:hypothetical protein
MMRWSKDGTNFDAEGVFVERGGVPSLARMPDGRLVAAFQWFPFHTQAAFDRVAVRFSNESVTTWTAEQPIVVTGLPEDFQRPFDPTVVALADGKVRMYFSCGKHGQPQSTGGPPAGVGTYSALSSDGINYVFEPGARMEAAGKAVIDCAVTQVRDKWHYVAPIGRPEDGAYYASSADGLNFTRGQDIPSSIGINWTGNLLEVSDKLRFYGSSMRGTWYSDSADGSGWSQPTMLKVNGGDPAVARTAQGNYLMVYVSQSKRTDQHPFHRPMRNDGDQLAPRPF